MKTVGTKGEKSKNGEDGRFAQVNLQLGKDRSFKSILETDSKI